MENIVIKIIKLTIILIWTVTLPSVAVGNTFKIDNEDFIAQHSSKQTKPSYVWLTGEIKKKTKKILDHKYYSMRVPYWHGDDGKTIWILEEIGKEKPITVGIVIKDKTIHSLRILAFRESRGWEVKFPYFTDQFDGLTYRKDKLSGHIDSISGATLSVRAVSKVSKLALYLDSTLH